MTQGRNARVVLRDFFCYLRLQFSASESEREGSQVGTEKSDVLCMAWRLERIERIGGGERSSGRVEDAITFAGRRKNGRYSTWVY